MLRNWSYHLKDKTLPEHDIKLESRNGWVKIPCRNKSLFKFGATTDKGKITAVILKRKEEIKFTKTFKIFKSVKYAHGVNVEVFNSGKYNYCEVEIHSPFVALLPEESFSCAQKWELSL